MNKIKSENKKKSDIIWRIITIVSVATIILFSLANDAGTVDTAHRWFNNSIGK